MGLHLPAFSLRDERRVQKRQTNPIKEQITNNQAQIAQHERVKAANAKKAKASRR